MQHIHVYSAPLTLTLASSIFYSCIAIDMYMCS